MRRNTLPDMLRVLYLFAGAKRRGSLKEAFAKLAAEFRTKVQVTELDALQGGQKHNMLKNMRRKRLLQKVVSGNFDVIVTTPPCSSFSRARFANKQGPRPVRSQEHPRGFPWLGKERKEVNEANLLVDFSAKVLAEQFKHDGYMGIIEHPEHLGTTTNGMPGTIWEWPAIKQLVQQKGVQTGAFY